MSRGLAALLVGLAVGASAWAQPEGEPAPSPPTLGWTKLQGAEGCIDGPELTARIERLLGTSLRDSTSGVTVDGWIARRLAPDEGFVAGVALLTRDGEVLDRVTLRTHTNRCRLLDGALTRLVARTVAGHAGLGRDGSGAPRAAPRPAAPAFNPYLPAGRTAGPVGTRRTTPVAAEPPPNPYDEVARGQDERELRFNPYLGQPGIPTPPGRVAGGTSSPAPVANPYLTAPDGGDPWTPGFNPYRP